MYQYTDFDKQFVRQRAAQFRDQLERNLAGKLGDEEFRPLRLQNGWYVQRHAPMLRVAVPYGELSSVQVRQLARIAREFDRGYAHFTTRQNVQYNWIPLTQAADVMDLLAEVNMHGIQTSGNCIRNITADAMVGVAEDEIIDARPYCEVLRQWSTLHPEFAFLPRKFKIAVSGAKEDRAAIYWHDIGLQLLKDDAGEVGFKVIVGGGMGRTPITGTVINAFVPWQQILVYIEAIVRVYNRFGRRDNMYKARIKILVKAEGQKFFDQVNAEFNDILTRDVDGAAHLIPQAEFDRVNVGFDFPAAVKAYTPAGNGLPADATDADKTQFSKWLERNVRGHKVQGYKNVHLSVKRVGQAPGDVTDAQMDLIADMADQFSCGELRVTHDQNVLLPFVREDELFALIERYQDLDELYDIGEIDLHISGCINSCGHHHTGHIGILGVDKDGTEWYQVTLGGSDGSDHAPTSVVGKVIGPSFAADEVSDVIEAVIETYKGQRVPAEKFVDTVKRIGLDPFKAAANAVRRSTAKAA
jgi:sulfite reductase (NADPH) hemoprotein beta-component